MKTGFGSFFRAVGRRLHIRTTTLMEELVIILERGPLTEPQQGIYKTFESYLKVDTGGLIEYEWFACYYANMILCQFLNVGDDLDEDVFAQLSNDTVFNLGPSYKKIKRDLEKQDDTHSLARNDPKLIAEVYEKSAAALNCNTSVGLEFSLVISAAGLLERGAPMVKAAHMDGAG